MPNSITENSICLFVFRPTQDFFTGEGLQILTYARHGASVYNGHLWGPVTLTPIAGRLAVELSLPVFTTYVCRGWDSNTQPSACGVNALTHCATAAAFWIRTFGCVTKFSIKGFTRIDHVTNYLHIPMNSLTPLFISKVTIVIRKLAIMVI